jgi:hypothetical protein
MKTADDLDVPRFVEDFFRGSDLGRWRMLALTFQFHPQVFESRFGWVLERGNIQCDIVTGEEVDSPRNIPYPYRIWRANWPGTFHPKVFILLANDRVTVGIGSSNLTSGGLGGNLEAWDFFSAGENSARPVLMGIREFLEDLRKEGIVSDRVNLEELILALPKGKDKDHALLSTLRGSLIDQVGERISKKVSKIDIVSPINCNPTKLIGEIINKTGASECNLFTNTKKLPKIEGVDKYWDLVPPSRPDEDEKYSVFATPHAKIFSFSSASMVDIFWGSANLSPSAWLKKGRAANVDILVHSRVSPGDWKRMQNNLPAGHKWKEAKPKKYAEFPVDPPPRPNEWRLLHAIWDGKILTIEASRSGKIFMILRSPNNGKSIRGFFRFDDRCLNLSQKSLSRLGFSNQAPPDAIQWRTAKDGEWQFLPINLLNFMAGSGGSTSVADFLFWRYTGRSFPKPNGPPKPKPPTKHETEYEEDELTRSSHQGRLDQFVLKWRAIGRRIEGSCGTNVGLLEERITEALRLMEKEAQERPPEWPSYKRDFVEELFDEFLKVAKCREEKK